ncbi:MAG TPA: efflux RND transporter permease subunit [Elusimicrobiota bacterium]|nr:efflux RND transporter permease subunit [Elusimicrobiota bacterium]
MSSTDTDPSPSSGTSLCSLAITRPIATLMVFIAASLLGSFSIFHLPVDLMPNSGAGSLTVFIGVRGGLPPEDIESLVTKIVEEAVSATSKLQSLMSVSRKDRSVTTLIFEPGTNVAFSALEVQERLAKVRGKLPKDIEKPIVAHYEENDYPIMIVALTSDKYTPEMLRDMVDNTLKPQLMRIDGVGNIEIGGGRQRKILVEFDQQRLEAYQLPIRQIIGQLGENNLNLLTGKTKDERNSYYVRTMGQFQTMDDIKKMTVAVTKEGSRVRVGDIAEVRDFYLEPDSYARLNKKPTVSVYIQKESQTNTIRTAKKINETLKKFQENLDPEITLTIVSNQAIFIQSAISNVTTALWQGLLLTALILWVFIRDIKHTAIILVSIPLSVLLTFGLMYLCKIGINVMTLSGIALGIGMLVDNSIVVLESVVEAKEHFFKHHPDVSEVPRTVSDPLISEASQKMTLPILASTLCTVIVFIPILFINKQVQILYTGLALTVTFSLVVSFFVALTAVPLLSALIPMRREEPGAKHFDIHELWYEYISEKPFPERLDRWMDSLKNVFTRTVHFLKHPPVEAGPAEEPPEARPEGGGEPEPSRRARLKRHLLLFVAHYVSPLFKSPMRLYRNLMSAAVRYRYQMLFWIFVAFLVSGFVYTQFLEKDFMGSTEPNEFIIFVELPAGAKLDISDQVVAEVEKILSDTPEIQKVVKTAAARVEGWSSKIYVTLVPQAERTRPVQDIINDLRPRVAEIGAVYDTFIYFSEPESSKELLVDVYGFDYNVLRDVAVGIAKRLQNVKGLTDIKLRYKPGRPEVKIMVDKDRAALFGFTVKDIAETLHAQIRGLRATYFYTATEQIETVARLQEKHRKTLEDLNSLTLMTNDGTIVPLQQVSTLEFSLTPSEIWRKDKQRMIQVSSNREKLALSTAVKKSAVHLKGMDVPQNYYYQFGGDYQQMIKNEQEFKFAFLIMVGLVYIVLACLFESYAQPLLIMLTVPLAIISVVPVLYFSGTSVTMGTYLGLIMLGGLVVTNAIILLDRLNAIQPGENLLRAVMLVGKQRLKAITLVQLTTILDLLPMIWDKSESAGLWSPLAISVVGGITGATILTLFVIPGCFLMIKDYENYKNRAEYPYSEEEIPVPVSE